MAAKSGKPGSRLAVHYIDDEIVLSATHAWTYSRLPLAPYEFLSQTAREGLCNQITLALASLVTSNQEAVDVHLRMTSRPFDTSAWAKRLHQRVTKWGPTPGWPQYLTAMGAHVDRAGFDQKEVYLGVCLGERRRIKKGSGGPLAEVSASLKTVTKAFEKAGRYEDLVVSPDELDTWRRKARDVHRTLGNSHLRGAPATAGEIARLIARPLWPAMDQPDPTATPTKPWGPGDVRSLGEGVVTNHRRWVEVEQAGDNGMPESGFSITLAVSRFPDVLMFPEQEPWMHYAAAFPFPTEFSTRMSIVPAMKVKKDVSRKLADAKDQAQHIAEAGTSIPLQVREQLEVATVLEYQIDKDRMPWAYARHRITVSGATAEEAAAHAKTLIESYRELGIDLAWPTGDQFDLLCESMPGDTVRVGAYLQRQELAVVAGGMPTASAECGDKEASGGWHGPYLGYTTSRVVTPVFLSPHLAMARNYPPGISITGSPGGGKALALDTPIPTPSGWTTMRDLQVGDLVFGPDGKPTCVLDTSPVFEGHDCFRVEFDDGSSVIADAQHRWEVETRAERRRSTRASRRRRAKAPATAPAGLGTALGVLTGERRSPGPGTRRVPRGSSGALRVAAPRDLEDLDATTVEGEERLNVRRPPESRSVITTQEMATSYLAGPEGRKRYSIPLAAPLDLPEADLPVDPYLLGVWLGDGWSRSGEAGALDQGIDAAIAAWGRRAEGRRAANAEDVHADPRIRTAEGLREGLAGLGLLRRTAQEGSRRRIPPQYLRASLRQRRALLAGLMDTDGYAAEAGRQEFCGVSEPLARDCYELLISLGLKATFRSGPAQTTRPDGARPDGGVRYRVAFRSTTGPRLARKTARPKDTLRPAAQRRSVTSVTRVESVPTKCITVAHPSHLFLAGEQMVPTHNSFSAFTLAYQMAMQGIWTIYIDPKADAKPMAQLGGLGSPRIFDLRDGNDGMLDPFALGETRSESTLLALETLRLLLGGSVSEEREEALLNAVERVAQSDSPSLSHVVDVLLGNEESAGARNLGAVLRTIRELPFARLCFAPTGGSRFRPEDGLTVVTLLGLDLPSASTRPDDYSYENRLAVSVMYLLTRYARGLMLSLDKGHPKAICIDEAWAITSTPQGAKLIPEIARMGRSHNTALVLVSQNAGDLMAESVTNSISTKLAFRSTIPAEIDDVLTLFGLDLDQGYQSAVRDLRNGECLMQDVDGRVSRVKVDDWNRELFEAFNTNPETRGKGSGAPPPGA